MDHEPPNEATISHLSSLLLENGHISSPLTLHSLFPSLNSNSTSNNSINSREIYQIQTKTLNQLTKCLYSLISSKSKSTNIIQELLTSIRVNEYELERNKNKTKIQFDKIKLIENEKEELKAKLINMSKELDNEKDKCKIAREESIKARSALQSLKTQFNHDLKRRETEMQTTQTKFQRLTSDPAQTKFIILNPSSFPTTSSSILPASISSRSTTATITNKTLSAAEHNKQINLEGENLLISEALKESDETLRTVKHDNFEMRELLGEIQDWCSVIGEIKGVQLGATNDDDKDHDQVDLSYEIPKPYLSEPLPILSSKLHAKLYHIRNSVSELVEATESRLDEVRNEMLNEVEMERYGRAEEKQLRLEVERELETAKKVVEESDKLIINFTSGEFLKGTEEETSNDAEEDAIRAQVLKDEAIEKNKKAVDEERRRARHEASKLGAAQSESTISKVTQPSISVKDFLSELEDSPVSKPKTLTSSVSASTSATVSTRPTTTSTTSTSTSTFHKSSSSSSRGATSSVVVATTLPPLSEVDEIPSPFLSKSKSISLPPSVPSTTTTTIQSSQFTRKASSKLSSILTMLDSPPPPVIRAPLTAITTSSKASTSVIPSSNSKKTDEVIPVKSTGSSSTTELRNLMLERKQRNALANAGASTSQTTSSSTVLGRIRVEGEVKRDADGRRIKDSNSLSSRRIKENIGI